MTGAIPVPLPPDLVTPAGGMSPVALAAAGALGLLITGVVLLGAERRGWLRPSVLPPAVDGEQ